MQYSLTIIGLFDKLLLLIYPAKRTSKSSAQANATFFTVYSAPGDSGSFRN